MFREKISSEKFCRIHKETPVLQASGKENPTKLFSCKFYKIFKNTFFTEHMRVTASGVPFFVSKAEEYS